jgi:hypothetical protein
MGTPGNRSSPRLAWFFTFFFILVIGIQIFLGFVYNTSSTPPVLILFNGLITLITFALALFQIFPGGIQVFFGSLQIPGLTTFLRKRAPFIVLSLILIISLSLVQLHSVVEHSDFSPTRFTGRETRLMLAS